jgi:hypothetical protein
MQICIPTNKYEFNAGLDSNTFSFHINFDTTFRKYFPDGIKLFSRVTEIGWIYYENNFESDPILYEKKSSDGHYLYSISMPDSLSFFQRKSKSDFLFVIHSIMIIANSLLQKTNLSDSRENYESLITLHYSFWNTHNSDLVATDQITANVKFDLLSDKWPFRGVTIKSAYEIFRRLPMFSK